MPSKTLIDYIDLRVFAHATEDSDKVFTAVHNMLPAELIDNVSFMKTSLTGHHGNPILLIEARIKDERVASAILDRLAQGLPSLDKETLCNDISQHLEKGNLYLRLDKQSAYLNEFRLGQIDSIRLRIHFRKRGPTEMVDVCETLGLLP